jgi:hypothetical protein
MREPPPRSRPRWSGPRVEVGSVPPDPRAVGRRPGRRRVRGLRRAGHLRDSLPAGGARGLAGLPEPDLEVQRRLSAGLVPTDLGGCLEPLILERERRHPRSQQPGGIRPRHPCRHRLPLDRRREQQLRARDLVRAGHCRRHQDHSLPGLVQTAARQVGCGLEPHRQRPGWRDLLARGLLQRRAGGLRRAAAELRPDARKHPPSLSEPVGRMADRPANRAVSARIVADRPAYRAVSAQRWP